MNNFLLERQQKVENIALLTEFVSGNPESRELNSISFQGFKTKSSRKCLVTSQGFLEKILVFMSLISCSQLFV